MNHYLEQQYIDLVNFYIDEQGQTNSGGSDTERAQPYTRFSENTDPYITSFVCLLAPRFKEHLLIGDISELINIWMKDICISFGWQLRFIDVHPDYLHWIMAVRITSVPTRFMKIVRRETSKKIFDDFPRFKEKNMSNEFWAPWYFVGVGEVPYSRATIRSFINQIRFEQGLQ